MIPLRLRLSGAYAFFGLFAAALLAVPVVAQPAPPVRIKAALVAVEGDVIEIQPLTDSKAKPGEMRRLTLMPETRYVESRKGSFAAIRPGGYAGAAVTEGRGGALRAREVFVYDDALRGTGEGRFTERDRLLVNGTVKTVQPNASQDSSGGTLVLHYHGADLDPQGRDKAVCVGRAVPAPFASALACEADATIDVPSGTPMSALTVGDRNLLVPGATLTVTIARVGDRDVAPGIIVEKPQPAP